MKPEEFLTEGFLKQFKNREQLNDFLGQLQKRGIEKMLEGELDGHLGYGKHEQSDNSNARRHGGLLRFTKTCNCISLRQKKTPMNPHHRPSAADGITEPVPGFLVGGPNRHAAAQDKCVYDSLVPELQYTDAACSFASNEIAINWNAPLVYITGAMESIKYQLHFND